MDIAHNDTARASTGSPSAWFLVAKSNPAARVRLYCFPHAGRGASMFRHWGQRLGGQIEVCAVQLPGRENRIAERRFNRLAPLVETLGDVILPHIDRPFAFFGHSMGALISYELARYFSAVHDLKPACLLVSAYRAPHLKPSLPPLHALPRQELLDGICQLGGMPDDALADQEFLDIVLDTLRADLAICESYQYLSLGMLQCPIIAFRGIDDARVTADDLSAWRKHTTGPFREETFPGEHFFIHDPRSTLLQSVSRELQYFYGL
jgi:medium-chain acyl-[acyl-carrier-protein] hydrolase